MKKILSVLLAGILMLGTAFSASAATQPAVARTFALDMEASLGYYEGKEYIVLDISVVDIKDPYGIVSIELDIEFDGDKLDPLWKTDLELNGDGESKVEGVVPPQMITAWPTYERKVYVPGQGLFNVETMAAKGLCKAYDITGKGLLNVNLLCLTQHVRTGVKEDGGMAVRLYFTPVDGFENGATYTFTVNGDYDIGWENRGQISLAATSALVLEDYEGRLDELRIFGYGDRASVKVRGVPSQLSKGDVNGDGVINSLDASTILKHDAMMLTLDADASARADVTGDGKVNSLDAAKILKFDAYIIDSLD